MLLVGQSNQGVAEVLIKISDAISLAVNLPSPADEDFLKLPGITFERYLQQVVTNLDGGLQKINFIHSLPALSPSALVSSPKVQLAKF